MCVSKRWCSLVVDNPRFDDPFLRVQIDKQRPVTRSLIFTNPIDLRDFFTTSEHPWAPKRVLRGSRLRCNLSLSFLPCIQGPVKKIAEGGEPIVVAAHKDFVFCSGTRWFQQDYYTCYPYTMQWNAIPPPPQCTKQVIVGLMCNPYNNLDERRVCDDQCRYRVVQIIIPNDRDERCNSSLGQFKAEIFCFRDSDDGFVIGLDPYENYITPPPASPTSSSTTSTVDGNNYINCHFIDKPEGEDAVKSDFLGAFRSSSGSYMGMCLLVLDSSGSFRDLCAWDYVKDDQAAAGKCYWRLGGRVNLKSMVTLNPLPIKWALDSRFRNELRVLALDPNDEDILYLELFQHIVKFNGVAGTLIEAWKTKNEDALAAVKESRWASAEGDLAEVFSRPDDETLLHSYHW
ncbi:hypothetical protein ACFX2B_005008 [Malus domestica]